MPAGFFAPHSTQNLPLLAVPQLGHVQELTGEGRFVPQSGQKLPLACAPQLGQTQVLAAGAAAGAGCCGWLNCCCAFVPIMLAIPMPMKAIAGPAAVLDAADSIAAAVEAAT